jgi:HD-GYP domain-containing protein (c-di-GMP phosphodiesterase class II)
MLQNKPRKIDFVEKVRLRVCDLRPGMFVCELDRPWLDTPFLLQGFNIADDADIEAIMAHCEYVYIDMMRTEIVHTPTASVHTKSMPSRKNPTVLEKDMRAAEETRAQTSKLIKTFVDEIRFGQSPDIQLAKSAVAECVASVVRNPEAMMFMTRLRGKDEYTSQHAFNVCIYSIVIGRLLGLDNVKLENLGTCGMLHDMGKVMIPDHIINKAGKLDDDEMAIIQTHAEGGRDILMSGRNIFSGTVDVAYGHHENLDGTGYPRGLEGFQMNVNSKIVAVVDKYDAITSQRPYRPEIDHLSAVSILNKMAKENKIDSELTSGLVSYLGIYPPGSIVELSSGEIGIVIESNPKQRLRPQILAVLDHSRMPIQRFIDLSEITQDTHGRPYRIVTVRRASDFNIDIGQYYDVINQVLN